LYPVAYRVVPSVERVSSPSDVAVPLAVTAGFVDEAVAGSAWLATGALLKPVVGYSSRDTAVAADERAVAPEPTR
jgi:hypothetical protein